MVIFFYVFFPPQFKGQNEDYDEDLLNYFAPYHGFIDVMCRLAINNNCMSEALIQLSAIVGFEGVPLHLTYFPKFWLDIYATPVIIIRSS